MPAKKKLEVEMDSFATSFGPGQKKESMIGQHYATHSNIDSKQRKHLKVILKKEEQC